MKTHKSKTHVEFVTDTKVELTFAKEIAVVNAPTPSIARQLAALTEASLVSIVGNRVVARQRTGQLKTDERIVVLERHRYLMFIAARKRRRELIRAYDLENAASN